MTFKVSKRVRPGDLVTKHGDKYVRCGPNRRPAGVYHDANRLLVASAEGLKVYRIPSGIIMSGRTLASIKEQP